ncbi:MAG: hypothetical protein L3J69_05130 [Desulfobacula sp.]|nr:hypothetical protein [Desulfobacula sp.]
MSKQYDPKMHSAEHLLNQTMVSKFKCDRCFSAHINKKKSKCDYHFDRPLADVEVDALQQTVNEQIQKDLPVTAEQMPITKAKEILTIKRLQRLPNFDDLKTIRMVRIGDYDVCPCIGPHVDSTKEIGQFKITTTGFEEGVLRIRFRLK